MESRHRPPSRLTAACLQPKRGRSEGGRPGPEDPQRARLQYRPVGRIPWRSHSSTGTTKFTASAPAAGRAASRRKPGYQPHARAALYARAGDLGHCTGATYEYTPTRSHDLAAITERAAAKAREPRLRCRHYVLSEPPRPKMPGGHRRLAFTLRGGLVNFQDPGTPVCAGVAQRALATAVPTI